MDNFPETLFSGIKENRRLGSRELLIRLLQGLIEWIKGQPNPEIDITELGQRIIELRPEMASFRNLGCRLVHEKMEEDNDSPLESILSDVLEQFREANQSRRDHFDQNVDKNTSVLTFSRSGTVIEVMSGSDRVDQVIVSHSYPGGEGVDVMNDLPDEDTEFVYDCEVPKREPEIDLLLIGCDQFNTDGDIVNKSGTELICRGLDDTRVLLVSDSFKWTPELDLSEVPTVSSPEGIPSDRMKQHALFETIDSSLIDAYLFEQGVFESPDSIGKINRLRDSHRTARELDLI